MRKSTLSQTGKKVSPVAALMGILGMFGLLLLPTSPGGQEVTSVAASSTSVPTPAAASPVAAKAPVQTDGPTGVSLEGYSEAAPATSAPDAPVQVQISAPPGATAVRSTVNDPECGVGFTKIQSAATPGFCIHTAADPLPKIGPVSQAASKAPICRGNGVNGPRIQLVYIYVQGQPNRSSVMVPRITNEFVPRMEGTYRETSKFQGREIGMRLHMPGCKLSVTTLEIDEANGEPDDPGTMLTRVAELIKKKGLVTTDRKFLVWLDAGNKGACGVAGTTVPLAAHVTDNAVTGNVQNIGYQAVPSLPLETSLIFRYGFPVLGEVPGQRECWGQGGTGARTEIHELTHSLGAVGKAAPNSNGFGHCTDDHDIMCYGERGVNTKPRCAVVVELLDCGADDYFNVRPNAGSYLSTHWNTATSRFLGDALVDNVPAVLPRP
jgi:hypothetical protein